MKQLKIIIPLIILLNNIAFSQGKIYGGLSFGKLKYFQGTASTRAFLFNNNTDVVQEMQPNQDFNGYAIGFNSNFDLMSFGLEFNSKKNSYLGKRSNGITDEITQRMHSYLLILGVGNRVDKSNDKKIIWRLQGGLGAVNFKVTEKLTGTTTDFDEVLGSQTKTLYQVSVGVWVPVVKHFTINVSPYIEALATDGYFDILQPKTNATEFFNITNYGVNLNLAYVF